MCNDCNLVIIALTNMRRDHVGLYGYGRPTTPNIDRFFHDGLIMNEAYGPASWTLPVMASMHTGRSPYTHGLMSRYQERMLPDSEVTLAEILRDAGFATTAFTGGGDYNRRFSATQGFNQYVDEDNWYEYGIGTRNAPPTSGLLTYLDVGPVVPFAIQWLQQRLGQRFFMLLHGYTHCPFQPRAPFDTMFDPDYDGTIDYNQCLWTFEPVEPVDAGGERRWPVKTTGWTPGQPEVMMGQRDIDHMKALYDGEIAQADADLGAFFAALQQPGLAERTLVLFVSEHGDLFGEHGRFMRGGPLRGTFYEEVLHIPMALRHPAIADGRTVNGTVEIIDVLPTLLGLLGVEDPAADTRDGVNLLPMLRDPAQERTRETFAASRFTACGSFFHSGLSVSAALRSGPYKLVFERFYDLETRAPTTEHHELYDLQSDPTELHDIAAEHPEIVSALTAKIEERLARRPAEDLDFRCQ